jgi:formylglycine-generating enzyme required for sulfatase activity
MENEKCSAMKRNLKYICSLLVCIGVAIIGRTHPLWSSRVYYVKGMEMFRACEYQKAAVEFEFASFKVNDATVPVDSVNYMQRLSLDCQMHRDSGDVKYEARKYDEAFVHYEFVSQHNVYDSHCREMMTMCQRKSKKGAFANMALMEPGNFKMGRNDGPYNEGPSHVVYLNPYYIDKSEVTNDEFVLFLNVKGLYNVNNKKRIAIKAANCHIKYDEKSSWFYVEKGYGNYPALGVTWYGAYDYAMWVGKSLPTEAQWEYAFGDAKEGNDRFYHNVGEGTPNKFGIYGMNDNGSEWVEDWYSDNAYRCSDRIDPEHHEIGEYKAIRGSKSDDDNYNPATYRDYELPTYSGGSIGFRCVKNISHVK